MKEYDLVEVLINPDFSTKDRKGWKCVVLEKWDEGPYLAVQDKLGVSWPLVEDQVKKIGDITEIFE